MKSRLNSLYESLIKKHVELDMTLGNPFQESESSKVKAFEYEPDEYVTAQEILPFIQDVYNGLNEAKARLTILQRLVFLAGTTHIQYFKVAQEVEELFAWLDATNTRDPEIMAEYVDRYILQGDVPRGYEVT